MGVSTGRMTWQQRGRGQQWREKRLKLTSTDATELVGHCRVINAGRKKGRYPAEAALPAHLLAFLEAGASRHILSQGLAGDGQAATIHQVALV
jgi:hypothetical protein